MKFMNIFIFLVLLVFGSFGKNLKMKRMVFDDVGSRAGMKRVKILLEIEFQVTQVINPVRISPGQPVHFDL